MPMVIGLIFHKTVLYKMNSRKFPRLNVETVVPIEQKLVHRDPAPQIT